jgi:hypothetical protein
VGSTIKMHLWGCIPLYFTWVPFVEMKLSHLPPDTTNGVEVGNSVSSLLVWIYPLKMTFIFQRWINFGRVLLKRVGSLVERRGHNCT